MAEAGGGGGGGAVVTANLDGLHEPPQTHRRSLAVDAVGAAVTLRACRPGRRPPLRPLSPRHVEGEPPGADASNGTWRRDRPLERHREQRGAFVGTLSGSEVATAGPSVVEAPATDICHQRPRGGGRTSRRDRQPACLQHYTGWCPLSSHAVEGLGGRRGGQRGQDEGQSRGRNGKKKHRRKQEKGLETNGRPPRLPCPTRFCVSLFSYHRKGRPAGGFTVAQRNVFRGRPPSGATRSLVRGGTPFRERSSVACSGECGGTCLPHPLYHLTSAPESGVWQSRTTTNAPTRPAGSPLHFFFSIPLHWRAVGAAAPRRHRRRRRRLRQT